MPGHRLQSQGQFKNMVASGQQMVGFQRQADSQAADQGQQPLRQDMPTVQAGAVHQPTTVRVQDIMSNEAPTQFRFVEYMI